MKKENHSPVTVSSVAAVAEGKLSGEPEAVVSDVAHDSRQAKTGSLFAAVRGELFDAHKFVPQVMQQGAIGVISELDRPSDFKGVWIQVANIRRAMAVAAAEIHHHPSRELKLVGITGTNGKTTCAYLIAAIPEAAGEPVAMTGTVEYRLGKERNKAGRTTPEATDMQRLLRQAIGSLARSRWRFHSLKSRSPASARSKKWYGSVKAPPSHPAARSLSAL